MANSMKTQPDVNQEKLLPDEPGHRPQGISRRDFIRYGGIAAAAATAAGAGVAGFEIGRSPDAYTGWGRTHQGGDMFFDREPFRADLPAMMEPVAQPERADWTGELFQRVNVFFETIASGEWNPGMGLETMPGQLGDYYRQFPERYEMLLLSMEKNDKRQQAWDAGKHRQYAISDAYNNSFAYSGMYNQFGSNIDDPHEWYEHTGEPQPPEKWDFRHIWRDEPLDFLSPKHATDLIKRMAHLFGASLVGVTKFDPLFMYKNFMRGVPGKGRQDWGEKVPEHWKSFIVFGVPMHWDGVYSATPYSTSYDAYFRTRNVAGLLERFIQELGHPARAQFPPYHYEVMMAPYVLKAGLGEYSRASIVMTPELGLNFRAAGVITDIEFEYDRPINIKMAEFCKKCKICAETCPSGAIPSTDEPETVVRGFKRWLLDDEKCYQQWCSAPTGDGMGCRVCVGVCPYTRKNTWIHTISRELEPRDPTGLVATGLLAMQQNFFKYPTAEEFRSDWDGGREATYHNPVWWQRSEDFFKQVEKTWRYMGLG